MLGSAGMRKGLSLWVIVLSLVLTRLTGLHLHACAGVEAGVQHAGTHYADNGFLFGDHHSEDDGDDREVELVAVMPAKIDGDSVDMTALLPTPLGVPEASTRLLTLVSPRGPPAAWPTHPPHFTPPQQGPPTSLA